MNWSYFLVFQSLHVFLFYFSLFNGRSKLWTIVLMSQQIGFYYRTWLYSLLLQVCPFYIESNWDIHHFTFFLLKMNYTLVYLLNNIEETTTKWTFSQEFFKGLCDVFAKAFVQNQIFVDYSSIFWKMFY